MSKKSFRRLRIVVIVLIAAWCAINAANANAQQPTPAPAPSTCTVNVNSATPEQLAFLARTGKVLAGRITEARPLDAAKLDAVKGVGDKWLAVNGPHITYTGATTCTAKIPTPKPVKPEQGAGK